MFVDSEVLARNSRRSVIQMTSRAKAAHTGSSLSVIDILSVVYTEIEKQVDVVGTRDVVLISKGHAAAGVYAVLAHIGIFSLEVLETYCRNGAVLGGHVTRNSKLGVSFSTGSLGHALPFALGKALISKRSGHKARYFTVISDGECDEGSNWEAALLASHLQLNNVCVLIDRNRLQSLGDTESTVRLEPLADKWKAFGWNVLGVNGHNHVELRDAINSDWRHLNCPTVIICETVKGYGVSFMENSVLWHYKPPLGEDYGRAMAELGEFE